MTNYKKKGNSLTEPASNELFKIDTQCACNSLYGNRQTIGSRNNSPMQFYQEAIMVQKL